MSLIGYWVKKGYPSSLSFDPLGAKPELPEESSESSKEKEQAQGDKKNGKCQYNKRRCAATFVRLNSSPCCPT
jgi:hypothetical protein